LDRVGPTAALLRADVQLAFMPLPDAFFRARGLLLAGRPAEAWAALLASPPASLPVWAWEFAEAALMQAAPQADRPLMAQRLGSCFASSPESMAARVPQEMLARRHAVALSILRHATPLWARPETLALAEALCAHHAGQPNQARAALARLDSLILHEADMAAVVWCELIEGGWVEASFPYKERALAAGSSPARTWVHGAVAYAAAAHQDWARVAMEAGAAAEAWPGFFNYHPLLVHALIQLGKIEQAQRRYAEASAGLGPENPQHLTLDQVWANAAGA